jgi:hypothetical protein
MPIFPTIKLNIERWKYNPTFELYVSNMGHVKNKSKADIAPKIMQNGYVVIHVGGSNPHWMLLHRLVMLTWKPTPEAENLTVDHLDHNKRNNALSNLEWVTREENERRAAEDYLRESTLVGNDVIVSKPSKSMTKKKQNAADIIGVVIRGKVFSGATMPPVFIKRDDGEALLDFCTPYVGKVNNFTVKGLRDIVKDIYSGKNCNGYKKWCGFEILAAYPDSDIIEKMEERAEK